MHIGRAIITAERCKTIRDWMKPAGTAAIRISEVKVGIERDGWT